MTTDREYLELAAKAAGHVLVWGDKYKLGDDEIDCTDIPYIRNEQPDEGDVHWNPIADDGDALRLAVKLGIEIYPDRECSEVITAFGVHQPKLIGLNTYEPFGNDEMAATRRAIVRAAAEIGRSME